MNTKKIFLTGISVIIWIIIWHILSLVINRPIILPTPLSVAKALFGLVQTREYYHIILSSFLRILTGLALGIIAGIVLSVLSLAGQFFDSFFSLPVKIMKSVPVASFIILCLFMVSVRHLTTVIGAITVTPIIYENITGTCQNTDKKLLEFSLVYRLSFFKKLMYIYVPPVFKALIPAVCTGTGFAIKSGVAAEIIGLVSNSIGNELYKAKIYLEMPSMLAWTISLVVAGLLLEKIMELILKGVCVLWEKQ